MNRCDVFRIQKTFQIRRCWIWRIELGEWWRNEKKLGFQKLNVCAKIMLISELSIVADLQSFNLKSCDKIILKIKLSQICDKIKNKKKLSQKFGKKNQIEKLPRTG